MVTYDRKNPRLCKGSGVAPCRHLPFLLFLPRVLIVAVPRLAPGLGPPSILPTCSRPGPHSRSPGQPNQTSLATLAAGPGAEAAGGQITVSR